MSAAILPFPAARLAYHVECTASWMAMVGTEEAEAHLASQLREIRQRLDRIGVERPAIKRDLDTFEDAVRAALWQRSRSGGGA